MKAEADGVDSTVEGQRVDFRKKAIEEIVADRRTVLAIELAGGRQIFERGAENPDFHSNRLRSSFLAASQSVASALPVS